MVWDVLEGTGPRDTEKFGWRGERKNSREGSGDAGKDPGELCGSNKDVTSKVWTVRDTDRTTRGKES